jgi:hypothetical protein
MQFGAVKRLIKRGKKVQAPSESIPQRADSSHMRLCPDVSSFTEGTQKEMAINSPSLSRRDSAYSKSENRMSIVSSGCSLRSEGPSEQDEREIGETNVQDAKAMQNVLSLCRKSVETGTDSLRRLQEQGERIEHVALKEMNQAWQASKIAVQNAKELREAEKFIPNPFTARSREDAYPRTRYTGKPKQIASSSSSHIEWHHPSLDSDFDNEQKINNSIEMVRIIVPELNKLAREMGSEITRQMDNIAKAEKVANLVGDNLDKSIGKIRHI